MMIRKWLAVVFAALVSVVVLPFYSQAEAAESAPGIAVKSGAPTEIDLSKTDGDVVVTSDGLVAGASVKKDLDTSINSAYNFVDHLSFNASSRVETAPDYTYSGGTKIESKINDYGYRFVGKGTNKSVLLDQKTMKDKQVKLILAGIDLTLDEGYLEYTCLNPITNENITFTEKSCRVGFIVSHANCVIEIEKNTVNKITGGSDTWTGTKQGTGCIVKNGEDGELHIKSSDGSDTGKLIINAHDNHVIAIGSQYGASPCYSKNSTWKDLPESPSNVEFEFQGENCVYGDMYSSSKFSFTNFYMESGYLECDSSGSHTAAIGVCCQALSRAGESQAQAYNLNFSGGTVRAIGGVSGPGIGAGGAGQLVDGIHFSNGVNVYAQGGDTAPGIGAGFLPGSAYSGSKPFYDCFGGIEEFYKNLYEVRNITIEGGTTYVKAIGDDGIKYNNPSPGIGATRPCWVNEESNVYELTDFSPKVVNCYATALKSTDGEKCIDPATGQKSDWQGYVKYGSDGESYAFSTTDPVTPFKGEGNVGKYLQTKNDEGENVYYTEVYFEPAHDHAALHKKENIQSNDYSCRTGGDGWTKEEIIDLLKVSGKDSEGNQLTSFTLDDENQLSKLNAAKKNCEVTGPESNGAWPITFVYHDDKSDVTLKCTSYVWLRDEGTPSEQTIPSIAANNLITASGGDEFTTKDLIGDGTWEGMPESKLKVVVQQATGINGQISDVKLDDSQLKTLNLAKTKGETGTFPITCKWTDPVSEKYLEVTSNITLVNIMLEKTAFKDSSLSQEYGSDKASVGDTIYYKIEVTNNSPYKVENIKLTDVEASTVIQALGAGETKEFTYADEVFKDVLKRKVTSEDAGKEITNTAKTTSGSAPDGTVVPEHKSSVAVNVKDIFDIKTNVTNGKITDGSVVNYGDDQKILYSSDEGYHIKSVTVDGEEVDIEKYPDSYTFENITADHEISVVYEIDKFVIKTYVENGIITDSATVEWGGSKLVEYAPEEGYHLESVTVDDVELDEEASADSHEFDDVVSDHEVKVVYAIDKKVEAKEEVDKDDTDTEEVAAASTPTKTETKTEDTQSETPKKSSLPSTGDGCSWIIIATVIAALVACYNSLLLKIKFSRRK